MANNNSQLPESYSDVAERQIIGSVLIDQESLGIAREIVKPVDFYGSLNQAIFTAMCELDDAGQHIDVVTLHQKLASNVLFNDKGGICYLMDCEQYSPTAALIATHANIVRADSIRRKISKFGNRLKFLTAKPIEDVDSIVAQLGDELLNLTSEYTVTPWKDFKSSLKEACDELFRDDDAIKITSGFADLDAKITGFKPGALTVVAARPAMGKTAFGLNVMMNVALNLHIPVAFFSLEMTTTELINRVLSAGSSINGNAIRQKKMNDNEWSRLLEFAEKYSAEKIFIDETPGLDITVLRERAKRMHRIHGIGLIIVDYLQLMHAENKRVLNREQEVATISRGLKGIAKELKIPVIALSQLNRALDARADKHPILSDLRESGAIEQDSDNILFIHREDYYRPDEEKDNTAEIIIAKQRSGPTGVVKLHWAGEYTRFSNLETTIYD